MNSAKPVTAVIVTYESRRTIAQALDPLFTAHSAGIADCVVVDNASGDGTADFVAANYPWVHLIRNRENTGFGRGCNRGFESVETPFVLFLNPDASIYLPALEVLLEFMEAHPNAGIAGPATLGRQNSTALQQAGVLLTPTDLLRAALGRTGVFPSKRAIVPGEPAFKTNWVCGAIMMIRSSSFRALGGFDPRYFLYFEETDLCLRAVRSGFEIWAVGEARAAHLGAISAEQSGEELSRGRHGNIVEHFYRSRFYYLVKNFGWLRAVGAEAGALAADYLRWGVRAIAGRADRASLNLRRPFLRFPEKPAD